MRNKYRHKQFLNEISVDESELGKDMLYTTDVGDILDDIEKQVKEIFDMLEPIKGLDLIDEIKNKVEKLVDDLY